MTIILIIAAILTGIAEGLYLVPRGMVKESIATVIILIIAIALQIVSRFGMTLISLVEKFLEPIGKMFLEKL